MENNLTIFIVSDSLGETARSIAKACIYQFPNYENWDTKRFSYINNKDLLNEVFEEAKGKRVLVMYSLVNPELADYAKAYCERENIEYMDLLSHILRKMKRISGVEPLGEPGIIRKMDKSYFNRVEAIEFAVKKVSQ